VTAMEIDHTNSGTLAAGAIGTPATAESVR
jgi:hypothetical protein